MLKIATYPSGILKKRAAFVKEITPDLRSLLLRMEETMKKHDGIGLAAPQVGISKQIILVQDAKKARAFCNPVLFFASKKQESDEEGCLSLPGLFLPVRRSAAVRVGCLTERGEQVIVEAEGLAARIFQHEIDHLQGKLIIDRITPVRRWNIRRQLDEIRKTGRVRSE